MRREFAAAWILASGLLVHCDLNPQPFPPGGNSSTAAAPPLGGSKSDAGSEVPSFAQDSSTARGADATVDASPVDGGTSAAFDAAADAPADTPSGVEDASTDSSATDAGEEADAPGGNDVGAETSEFDAEADGD